MKGSRSTVVITGASAGVGRATTRLLERNGQPVPPIFQPEVAARAILWAVGHRRRELFVGFSTSIAIWGNIFFPGTGDFNLAKTGFASQQHNEPNDPHRPDILLEPAPGQQAARGSFSDRSHPQHRIERPKQIAFLENRMEFAPPVFATFFQ